MAELEGVALVTGGGRGIGASVARELAAGGMRVAVTARTREQVEAVAQEIGGRAFVVDVSEPDAAERVVGELGEVDLLVNNAGITGAQGDAWRVDPDEWWRTFEVNVRAPYLFCRAVLPGMLARGRGRIVDVTSGAAYLPATSAYAARNSAYGPSKAALHRFTELLAAQLAETPVRVFSISPGLVRTEMTSQFPDDSPWTPPELAPRLVRAMASGRLDMYAGRYLHAEHDADVDALVARADEVVAQDLHAIRLRR